MTNQLIKTIKRTDGRIAVNARDLYNFLEIKTGFNHWIKRMIKSYGFLRNSDYIVSVKNDQNLSGGRPHKDFILSLDMAKEISMVQRNYRGREARRYFIDIQKRYMKLAQPQFHVPQTKAEALQLAANQAKKIEQMQPVVNNYNLFMRNPGTMTTTSIAKDYGMSAQRLNMILNDLGVEFRQGKTWVLYAKYQDKGLAYYDEYRNQTNDKVYKLLKWTTKGQKFIHDLLAQYNTHLLTEKQNNNFGNYELMK